MSVLAELATAIRRVRRLRDECPEAHRPKARDVFRDFEAAHAEVRALIANPHPTGERQALAVVADWEREASSRITAALAHAPIEAGKGA